MELIREIFDLKHQRAGLVEQMTAADAANDAEKFKTLSEQVDNLNTTIERKEHLAEENSRYKSPVSDGEQSDAAAERGNALMHGKAVSYSIKDVAHDLGLRFRNATTLAGTIVEPTTTDGNIRGANSAQNAIIDEVYAVDMTGMGGFSEPYVKTEMEANGQKVTTAAGTLRADSEPALRIAKSGAYEVNITSYVDRNINRLSPAAYEAKNRAMAMRAMRRKICSIIFNGDGQATPDMYGIKNASNSDAESIFKTLSASAVDVDLLSKIVFGYGGDEELGGAAKLYLTKADLQALGALRGTNEKKRLYDITPAAGNANSGMISDGGLFVPYSLSSALTSLSTATAGAAAIKTMVYGDPLNYELGLFGEFTIRIDESYKAGERLLTILGDMMIGGNLVADGGFEVVTVPAQG